MKLAELKASYNDSKVEIQGQTDIDSKRSIN